MQVANGAFRGGAEFIGQRGHVHFGAIAIEHLLQEKVAADKHVPGDSRLGLAEDRGDSHIMLYHRHVAGLAGLRVLVIAVQPFLKGHLLGEFSNDLPLRVECLGEQSVAGGAQLCGADYLGVLGGLKVGRRPHDGLAAGVDLIGAEDVALAPRRSFIDLEAANKALRLPEIVPGNLMADGAGNAVLGEAVGELIRVGRQVIEHRAFTSRELRLIPHHGHVADGALVLNGALRHGMIDDFTAHAGHPVGVPAGISHDAGTPAQADRDVFSRGSDQAVVAGETAIGSLKMRAVTFGMDRVGGGVLSRCSLRGPARLRLGLGNGKHGDEARKQQQGSRDFRPGHVHFQPCVRAPST